MGNSTETALIKSNKTQTDNKTREAKAKTCFCQRSSRESAGHTGSKNSEEAMGGRTGHHAGAAASLRPSPSPTGGRAAGWGCSGCQGTWVAVAGFLPLHMPGLIH